MANFRTGLQGSRSRMCRMKVVASFGPRMLSRLSPFSSSTVKCSLALCHGLKGGPVESIHPSQGCVARRFINDNIFQTETCALALSANTCEENEVLVTDLHAPTPASTTAGVSVYCANSSKNAGLQNASSRRVFGSGVSLLSRSLF